MQNVIDNVDKVIDRISQVAQSGVVTGTPIEVGGVTLVPLSRVSLGMGGGGGEGRGETPAAKGRPAGRGAGSGVGGGGGAKVRPVGVIAFTEAGVQVLPIPDKRGTLDKMVDRIPELIEMATKAGA